MDKITQKDIESTVIIFKALADETRMHIITTILDEAKAVSDIVKEVEISQSGVSHQLRALKEASIIKRERRGRKIFYSLDDDHIKTILSKTIEHAKEEKL